MLLSLRKESPISLSISFLRTVMSLASEESERPTITELPELLEPPSATGQRSFEKVMLVLVADFLRSRRLVTTTSLT